MIKVASPLGVGEGPITEADRGTLSVKNTLSAVEAQISDIEAQSAKTMDKVRSSLKAGQKAGAAAYLKSKKGLDDVLSKRIATGEQLRSVLRSIDDAKSNAEVSSSPLYDEQADAQIMSAYELSTSSLASALADPRLSPDRIANTTDALADVLADSKEISDAIEIGGAQARQAAGAPDFDEDELAAELDALVLEEKAAQKERVEQEARDAAARKVAEEKAAKEAEERRVREEKEKKEREERERAARVAAAQQAIKSSERTAEKTEGGKTEEDEWAQRHADAQQRQREEKERAERERLEKEAQRLPAE